MNAILAILYGVFLILVGIRGNAGQLANALTQEGQFVYWVIVLLVLAALWEFESGAELAKPFTALVIVAFLLRNWGTLSTNLRAVLPAPSGG